MKTMSLTAAQRAQLLTVLQARFEQNMNRHPDLFWDEIRVRLDNSPEKLWSLYEMERTGGEPDVIAFEPESGVFVFCDCAPESPVGRRSLCYDPAALAARKANKPQGSAVGMAESMGISLLTEDDYYRLQRLGSFDTRTSSWLHTPDEIRRLGGALFGDYRYGRVFVYHNGAESYYAARGFRGLCRL